MANIMEPKTSGQAHPNFTSAIPLATFAAQFPSQALIDAEKCAAIGDMSISWWHNAVSERVAPEPEFRKPRCTRWRLDKVLAFWAAFAAAQANDGEAVIAKATKASAAAKAKRLTATQVIAG